MSELPHGWTNFRITDIGGLSGGKTPSKADSSFWDSADIPWVSPKDMKKLHIGDSEDRISEKSLTDAGMTLYPKDSILMVTRSGILQHTFPVAITTSPVTVNQDIKVIRPLDGVQPAYLLHLLRACGQKILEKCSKDGTTVQSIATEKLEQLELPLAPLTEQVRIAQALDGLLAQVDTLKARLDGLPALIKRFRQSILAAAVSGKLTEDWRIHQALAATASKSVSDTQVEKWGWEEIPASWETCFYEDAFQSRLGKMLDKAKNTGDETPYLGNINVRWFSFDTSHTQTIRVSDHEAVDLTLTKGDVLICEGGEPGRCAVWNVQNGQYIYQKALHRARAIKSVLPEWLTYNLKNDADNKKLSMLFTGTTIKHLTGRSLATYPIRLPPLIEQNEIVRRVEQLFAFADQLEARLTDARARVDALTQSILAKAFRGELVPQDPADEPASVLLERIKAQRATAPKPKRGRKSV